MVNSGMSYALLEEAVRDGRPDVVAVAHEVGASAAQMGIPLHEVLDHVERAHAQGEPPFATVRAAALAWAEKALLFQVDVSCEHPLTSLSTVPHVRSRLGDVYRGAERAGARVADTHVLVVVELPRTDHGNHLEQSLHALEVAETMRAVFAGEETIGQMSTRRFVALAARDRADPMAVNLLALLLERTLGHVGRPRLWVEQLPGSADDVPSLLAALCA
jgi:hypothetical protein